MKTAEDWYYIYNTQGDSIESLIKQIQLDAFKAGMTEAAEIADKKVTNWGIEPAIIAVTLRDEILSARDRKERL